VLTVPADDAEVAGDRLWSAGARAVEERDLSGGRTELRCVLSRDDRRSAGRLGEVPADWQVAFVDVDDELLETWRDDAEPVQINGRLVVRPAWRPLASPAPTGVTEVTIEPAGSFGLGDHPTTRLSADAVDRLTRQGDRVLDVGCGTGVLAIIAALRGAGRIVAVDISDAAVETTLTNAEANGVAERIDASTRGLCDIDETFDVVVANILAPALTAMASDLRRLTSPTGRLVVSGILADAHGHVLAALRPMEVSATRRLDDWAAVELRHPA